MLATSSNSHVIVEPLLPKEEDNNSDCYYLSENNKMNYSINNYESSSRVDDVATDFVSNNIACKCQFLETRQIV